MSVARLDITRFVTFPYNIEACKIVVTFPMFLQYCWNVATILLKSSVLNGFLTILILIFNYVSDSKGTISISEKICDTILEKFNNV